MDFPESSLPLIVICAIEPEVTYGSSAVFDRGDPSASWRDLAQQPLCDVASRQPTQRGHRLSPLRVGGGDCGADQKFNNIGKPIAGRCTVTATVD
jgi:hypothetical protein